MQVARRDLRLLAGDDSREGYVRLAAGRVCRTGSGAFQMDPHFVPPLVDFCASEYLTSIARRLLEILAARSSAISGMRRQKNQTLADFTSADIANFWLLRALSARAPYFHNGIAASLEDVVRHYERRLNFVFTDRQRQDLVAFLRAL